MGYILEYCRIISIVMILSCFGCNVLDNSGSSKDDDMVISTDTINFPSMRYYPLYDKFKNSSKPILIYFNSFGCLRCRQFEEKLRDSVGMNVIQDKFEFINLYLDDRTFLPKEEWYKDYKSTIKTVGSENSMLQRTLLATGSQPYLAVLKKDSIVEYISYKTTKEIKEYFKRNY